MPIQERSASEIHNQRVDRFEAWCREKEFDHGNLRQLIWRGGGQDLDSVNPLTLFTHEELDKIDYPNPNNIDYSEWTQPKWSQSHKPELQILTQVFWLLNIHSRDTDYNRNNPETILLQDQALHRFLDWAGKNINPDITYSWSHAVLKRLQEKRY